MKKQLTIFIIFLIITSCTSIRQIKNQKIESITNCSTYNIVDNQILFKAKIDDVNQVLFFDTGATMSVLMDTNSVDLKKKEIGSLGSLTLADKKKIKLITVASRIQSDLFFSENKIFAYLPIPKSKCEPKSNFNGILGLDCFFYNDNLLFFDFSSSKICNILTSDKERLIKEGYTKVKSECQSKQIFIYLKIDNVEYKFKFDTGFFGSIIMPKKIKLNTTNYKTIDFQGSLFKTAKSLTFGEDTIIENYPFLIGNTSVSMNIIQSSSVSDLSNIGLSFIKGFDWIIDFKNDEIYFKRNSTQFNTLLDKDIIKYAVKEKNNFLIIIAKQKQFLEYNIGDQIVSVNEKPVTAENICEMQELLNKTQDWNTLKLEVITPKK